LLANAIQHSKSGDVVRLESCVVSEDGKRHIVMRVIDMGLGIDSRLGNRVFERFYRGRAEYDGSGLGLAICKAIVERHGGIINHRPNLPRGTVFEVTLNAAATMGNHAAP
jgi:two-component system sensor histidine kinase DctS